LPWIRFDTAVLFDDFIQDLSGDEFKAWAFLLLYVKASGARGSAPKISSSRLSAMSGVSIQAVDSMFAKAGERFKQENGRISVKNWHRYQEDHRDKRDPEKAGQVSGVKKVKNCTLHEHGVVRYEGDQCPECKLLKEKSIRS